MTKTQTDANDEISKINLESLGNINGEGVFTEVENLAGTYGRYSALLLHSVREAASAKVNLDQLENQLDLQIREGADIAREKTTERKVEAKIKSTPAWKTAHAVYADAEAKVDLCKSALKTLDKKERMLELLARFQIREYGINQRSQ